MLSLDFVEYDLATEWQDAAEHAAGDEGGARGGAKALLLGPGLPELVESE